MDLLMIVYIQTCIQTRLQMLTIKKVLEAKLEFLRIHKSVMYLNNNMLLFLGIFRLGAKSDLSHGTVAPESLALAETHLAVRFVLFMAW